MTMKLKQQTRSLRLALGGALLGITLHSGAAEPSPLFIRSCAGCHGPDGRADTKMGRYLGVKDLTQSKLSEADIEQAIRHGVAAADGRRRMPAFEESLSAEDIKALAAVVKTLQK